MPLFTERTADGYRVQELEPAAVVLPTEYVVGLDLGQAHDFTAIAVAEVVGGRLGNDRGTLSYAVRHLERVRGKPYPEIVRRVGALLATPELRGNARLVVDSTGVGRPVVDLLRQAGLSPVAVTITGGDIVTHEGREYRVPKRDLVAAVQVLLQGRRLRVAEKLPEAQLLTDELQNFQIKLTATAHDVYGAWREGTHDDLVLAVALACWWGEHVPAPVRCF
jgi:hypothetical protein